MYELDLETFQNAVLVDAAAFFDAFSGYSERLTPLQLADIFNIVDQIVLRDRIILVSNSSTLRSDISKALNTWSQEGALWLPKRRVSPLSIDTGRVAQIEGLGSAEKRRVARSVGRLAAAENEWRLPGMALSGQRFVYDAITAVDLERQLLLDLTTQLGQIASTIDRQLGGSVPISTGFVRLSIPPLALSVFQKIDRIDQLQEASLEERHKFQQLRRSYRDLGQLLRDEQTSDAKKLAEVRAWESQWQTLLRGEDLYDYSFQVGTQILPKLVGALSGLMSQPSDDPASALTNLALPIGEAAAQAYRAAGPKRFLMRPVYSTFRNYLATNGEQKRAEILRVVGQQLESARQSSHVSSRFGLPVRHDMN